ncbi:MAG TPA: PAS domain S-box protein [Usitatibacter sp.]|nr:PAS domain S-box protein [Usitatibacter sp.]
MEELPAGPLAVFSPAQTDDVARVQGHDELMAAREALRHSHELLRATFEQAGVGIGLLALDGRYTDVNAKFCAIVGYAREELMALRVWDITHADDASASRAHVADLLAQRVPLVVQEKRYVRKDSSVVWSRTSVSLLKDATGEPQRLISVIEDITERKAAEEALRQSNEFNRSLIESSGDCFKILALDGTLLWMSETGRALLCLEDVNRVIGKPWISLWEGEDRTAAFTAVAAAASGATGKFVGHYAVGRESRWWDVAVTPIRGSDGRPERLLAVSRDITERIISEEERKVLLESERAARAAAERANHTKDEFLATLSHELRTPLGAILGWTHVLRSGRASAADSARGLEAIERNARIQTQLIEDLLDMSRIMAGKMRLEMQPLDPAAFVEAALETARPSADAKGIRLEKVLEPGVGLVRGDASRLQQVVWNLLSNAVKFTPGGGVVRVEMRRVDSVLEIRVTDSGVGIDRAFLPQMFERFRQADGSLARRHGGLGLGLSIVKHVVDMHGGAIDADSAGPGKGACFTVRLPLAPSPTRRHDGASSLGSDAGASDLRGLRILVVDDDDDGRDLVHRLLTECGAVVQVADCGARALDILGQGDIELVVSDIGMPEMDGYELLRRARPLLDGRDVPVVALTAFARPEDRIRALRAGFAAHVAKPVEPAVLLSSVASLLHRVRPRA